MKSDKENALGVVKSMYDFHQVCDETKAWISEKDQVLSVEEWGRDLAGAQMLQRRHQVRVCVHIQFKCTLSTGQKTSFNYVFSFYLCVHLHAFVTEGFGERASPCRRKNGEDK